MAAMGMAAGGISQDFSPLAANEKRTAGTLRQQVSMLRQQYGDRYEIGYAGGCWLAIWLYAGNDAEPLSAPTPELLGIAIAADWAGRSAS